MEYVLMLSEYFVLAIGREFGKAVCARDMNKLVALLWVPVAREAVLPRVVVLRPPPMLVLVELLVLVPDEPLVVVELLVDEVVFVVDEVVLVSDELLVVVEPVVDEVVLVLVPVPGRCR